MTKKIIILLAVILPVTVFSQNWDIEILRDINLNRNKQYDGFFKTVTNSATPLAVGTPVIMYGVGLLTNDSTVKSTSFYIGASVLTVTVLSTVLKYTINRPRPFVTYPEIEKLAGAGSPSFPSGHTSDAFALATSVSISYPKWYVIAPSYIWAGAVGYSRMHLGVHYPSDVLAGAVLGTFSAYLSYKANEWLNQKHRKHICNGEL